jgi:lycopene cyclase domain-containing protein
MIDPLYLTFLGLFVVCPTIGLAVTADRTRGWSPATWRLGVPLVVCLAVLYTTPWDRYLVRRGVWTYADGSVVARLWDVPVAEYGFMIAQTGLVSVWLLGHVDRGASTDRALGAGYPSGLLAAGAVGTVGIALGQVPGTLYLRTLLIWATPVLALQWSVGWPVLATHRRTAALGVLVPTAYLCLVDRLAIAIGLWQFDPTATTGITLLGLPIEEALFFLLTSGFLVQGLVLFEWVVSR